MRASLITASIALASCDCPATTDVGILDVGIPHGHTVNGIAIEGDIFSLAFDRTRDTEITWSVDGDADHYFFTLYELQRNANNETSLRVIREIFTVEPRVIVVPDTFSRGDYYLISVAAHVGTPKARDGDFVTRSTPQKVADSLSRPFVIR